MPKAKFEFFPTQEDYTDNDLKPDDTAVLMCADADSWDRKEWPDNVISKCGAGGDGTVGCGKAIVHRPHYPARCVRLCGECVLKGVEDAVAKGDDINVRMTEKTRQEVRNYLDSKPEAANTKPSPWKWT